MLHVSLLDSHMPTLGLSTCYVPCTLSRTSPLTRSLPHVISRTSHLPVLSTLQSVSYRKPGIQSCSKFHLQYLTHHQVYSGYSITVFKEVIGKGVQQGSGCSPHALPFPSFLGENWPMAEEGWVGSHIFSLYRFPCPSAKPNFLLVLLSAKWLNS